MNHVTCRTKPQKGIAMFPPVDQKLDRFCDAVRSKQDWFIKILDHNEDLGIKWAKEAQLITDGIQNDQYNDVVIALQ
jgi:hypothetical protein